MVICFNFLLNVTINYVWVLLLFRHLSLLLSLCLYLHFYCIIVCDYGLCDIICKDLLYPAWPSARRNFSECFIYMWTMCLLCWVQKKDECRHIKYQVFKLYYCNLNTLDISPFDLFLWDIIFLHGDWIFAKISLLYLFLFYIFQKHTHPHTPTPTHPPKIPGILTRNSAIILHYNEKVWHYPWLLSQLASEFLSVGTQERTILLIPLQIHMVHPKM